MTAQLTQQIEDLHAPIAAVDNVDLALGRYGHALRTAQLPRTRAGRSQHAHDSTIRRLRRKLVQPGVGDIDQPVGTNRHAPGRAARALLQGWQEVGGNVGADRRRNRQQGSRTRQAGPQHAATGESTHGVHARLCIVPQLRKSSAR